MPASPITDGRSPADDVPKIKAALMLHYAENDEGVNAGIAPTRRR